ncbi:MAG TPA: MXAN_6577-like cysteine-rich protein [Thermomicrobiales bacterium]|nr:MXAN_6577-like cysteine-rich protein [Thermomicrobiales bacterium]
MDGNRFDAFARAVSTPAGVTRRRSLLRSFAAGAVAGIAGGVAHQAEAAAPVSCSIELTATIRSGPNAGLTLAGGKPGELTGTLSVTVGADGAIDQGTLQLTDGTALPVVGQATGRDLALRSRVGLGQTLVLIGVADQPVAQCAGAADGLLTGPQPGDLGDWHATMAGATGGATTAGATATTGAGSAAPTIAVGGSSPTPAATASGSVTPTAPAGTTPSPTTAPTSEPTAAPTTAPTAAPTTEPTMAPTAVSCPSGTTLCGDVCIDLQTDVNNCGACGHVCPPAQPGFVSDCAAGNCFFRRAPAPPCDSGLTRCAAGCVNLASDPANCGACGTACAAGQTCFNGICANEHRCDPGLTRCGDSCVDLATDAANCGACGVACATDEICFAGVCAREHR